MANIRVKDLPNTSAPAADTDEFIIDSSSAGTRRLNYGELKTAISGDFQSGTSTYKVATLGSDNKLDPAQIPDTLSQGMNFVGVANSAGDLTSTTQGDFYVIQTAFGVYSVGDQAVYDGSAYVRVVDGTKEISEGGTGATTLDAAKTNLEIINIGSSPNQVSLNSMLGDLAFQSSAGVSAAKLEVESTTGTATTQALTVTDGSSTKFVVREDGVTGINTASPHSNSHLDVGGAIALSGTRVLTASGTDLYAGGIDGSPSIDRIFLRTADANRVTIDSSGNVTLHNGNLVLSSGAIDFGSATTGSGTVATNGGLLDDYEAGSFVPVIADATSGGNVGSAPVALGTYTKVGRVVHISIVLANIDTTGMTAANTFYIRNLPFVSSTITTAAQLTAKADSITFDAGIVGSVVAGQSNAYLVSLRSANTDVNRQVGHIASGVADVHLTGSYITD